MKQYHHWLPNPVGERLMGKYTMDDVDLRRLKH